MRKKRNNMIYIMVLTLVLLQSVVSPLTVYALNSDKIVRVGYVNVPSYEEGGEGEYKSGSGYEFLQKISYQTGWKYQYVYGSFNELYQKLLRGEIDLFGDISYTPERAQLMNFPEYPMGKDNYYIYCLPDNKELLLENVQNINGKKIGVTKDSYQAGLLQEWLKKHNIQAQIVYYSGYTTEMADLDDGKIDMIATPRLAASRFTYATVADIGYSDYFFAVAKNRPDLLNELDSALYKISSAELNYGAALQHKYQKGMLSDTFLYPQEKAWLQEHNWTVRVGYLDNNRPYAYTNADTDELSGVLAELFNNMQKNLGVNFQVKSYKTSNELFAALENGEVDAIGPCYGDVWLTEQRDLIQSNAILATSLMLVRKYANDDSVPTKIAVARNSFIRREAVEILYPDAAIIQCDKIEDAVNSIATDEADAMIMATSQLNILKRFPKADNFSTVNMPQQIDVCLSMKKDAVELVNIFNKGIVASESLLATRALSESTYVHRKANLEDYIRENLVTVTLLLVIFVIFLIKYSIEKRELAFKLQNNRHELQNANKQLRRMNEELQAQHDELQKSYEYQQNQNQVLSRLNEELEEKEKAVQKASNAKSTFLFNMSHDIRTPMNAIIGFAELLKNKELEAEKKYDYVDKIIDSGKFLSTLINNVLDMARIESGQMELNEEVHILGCITQRVKSSFAALMQKNNLQFDVTIDVQTRYAYFDATKVQQVLFNLVSNAAKYTPAGGRVAVILKEVPSDREGHCKINVIIEDNGIGISEDYLPHIFDEFSRERNSTESNVVGTGLGLPIVKSLLDLLGGTIEVESKVGKGSCFTVTLWYRIADSPESVMEDSEIKPAALDKWRGTRILLTEDNSLNAEIAIAILNHAGFVVEHADDGTICMDMLSEHPAGYYALILMDIQMPHMDGYTATKKIRDLPESGKAKIPIIAMTANAFEEDKQKAFEAGMNAHIAKPIDVNELLKAMTRILAKEQ